MGRHFDRGMALYEIERYSEAISEFNQELSEDPECALSFAMRGASLFNLGRLRSAEDDIQQSLAIEPEFSYSYFVLSLIKRRQEQFLAAEKAILEALRLDHQPRYFRQLAGLLNDQGRANEAVQASKKALELDPTDEMSLVAHSIYLSATGNSADAEKHLIEARSINPEFANAHYAMGMFGLLHRQTGKSFEFLQAARRLAPTKFNKSEPIALAYVLDLWPFRVLRKFVPWWPGWSRDKQWFLLASICTLALITSWGYMFAPGRWVDFILVVFMLTVNLSAVPITVGNIANISARLFVYQEPKFRGFTFWKVMFLCVLVTIGCQYLASLFGRLCASFPPVPFLALACFSYRKFFQNFLRMDTILRGLANLAAAFLLIIPMIGGAIASLLDLRLGILMWIALLICSFFSDRISAWLNRPRNAFKFPA